MNTVVLRELQFKRFLRFLSGLLFWVSMVAVVRYQLRLLRYREWGDESETVVTVKMMAAGNRLYSEVFNHHGPLAFLPGYVLERFGDFGVPEHRIAIMVLQWAALFAIYRSPVLTQVFSRQIATVGGAVCMLLLLPEMWGHAYVYQAIAGALLVIILAQYTIPALVEPATLGRAQIYLGTSLLACLPFLAVTYGPLTLALYLASLRPRWFKLSVIGLMTGGLANLIFLLLTGSLVGYWVIHFYINLEILPKVLRSANALTYLAANLDNLLHGGGEPVMQAGAVGLIASSLLLGRKEQGGVWRSLLVFGGLATLQLRGLSFQALPLFYAAATIPLVVLQYGRRGVLPPWLCIASALLGIWSLVYMDGGPIRRVAGSKIQEDTEFSRLANRITQPGDKIIAYTFRNFEYIAAHRLPASGHFFYLPSQAWYNQHPRLGIHMDPCVQILSNRPKLMLIDKWTVWGIYSWDSYAGCLNDVIDHHYTRIGESVYYLRNDLAEDGVLMKSIKAEYGHGNRPHP